MQFVLILNRLNNSVCVFAEVFGFYPFLRTADIPRLTFHDNGIYGSVTQSRCCIR